MSKIPKTPCAFCGKSTDALFCKLSERALENLDSAKAVQDFGPRRVIFQEGAPPFAIYCLHRGAVKLFKSSEGGKRQMLRLLGPGEIFGYRAVLADEPYSATAETVVATRLCTIPADVFRTLVEQNPLLGVQLLGRLARELRISEDQMVSLTQETVLQRTARLLLMLFDAGLNEMISGPEGGALMRSEMAQSVGTSAETFSRTLRVLARAGAIEFDRKNLVVIDDKKLRKILNRGHTA
jgi:CRP/FNR family transcriptional regulator